MTGDNGKGGGSGASPAELRARIERTRHELGDTVAALAGKTDVKGRAQDRAARLKDRTLHRTAAARERLGGSGAARTAAVAGGALLAGALVLRRRTRAGSWSRALRTRKSPHPLARAGAKARSKGHHR